MPYRTVFNGTRMVYRKVEQKGGRSLVVLEQPKAEPEKPIAVQKETPVDKKQLRLKYAREIMKIM